MARVYTEVGVDVELSEFDTEDLIEELESRGGYLDHDVKDIVAGIWQKRRLGNDFSRELDELVYQVLGKII